MTNSQDLSHSSKITPFFLKINTSNPGKLKEYEHLFGRENIRLVSTNIDLDEIDADPLTVILHKASQLEEGVLVEDTSLEVEGTDIGVNIRWQLNDLERHLECKAAWILFLAYRRKDEVFVFKGEIRGKIVKPRQEKGFGFDPYFMPFGAEKTLAEDKPDAFNARAHAVKALIQEKPFSIQPAIYHWEGPWQADKKI